MKKVLSCGVLTAALAIACTSLAQQHSPKERSTIAQSLTPPALPLDKVEDGLIQFPLPKDQQAYAAIDGKKMFRYVEELVQISRRYRDNGHPKFWGRITGTAGDHETSEWLAAKFKNLGLSDIRIQPFDLPPQWLPKDWSVSVTQGGRTIGLNSAMPSYESSSLPAMELDAVYAGLGTAADFIGKDVRGKAVFIYGMLGLAEEGAVRRAADEGAAVVFNVSMLPGNMRYVAYPSGTKVPVLTLGNDDGVAVRSMIEAAGRGAPPKVKVAVDVHKVPNLKTALVWGTLPGATDETIYITAHRDGWFDAAGDNASGVAVMLGIAEHFANIPRAERPRTIVFIGLDGHHNGRNGGGVGRTWIADNRAKLFEKTALLMNIEHPSTIQSQARPRYYPGDEIAWGNTYMPLAWYGGGKQRPHMTKIVWDAFKTFGVPLLYDPSPVPPASDATFLHRFAPTVGASEYFHYFHTDWETPETVPWTGLEASTRAFAKIIDDINKLPLSQLKLPEWE